MERILALCKRRASFCLARLRAWGELATESPQVVVVQRREMIRIGGQKSKVSSTLELNYHFPAVLTSVCARIRYPARGNLWATNVRLPASIEKKRYS